MAPNTRGTRNQAIDNAAPNCVKDGRRAETAHAHIRVFARLPGFPRAGRAIRSEVFLPNVAADTAEYEEKVRQLLAAIRSGDADAVETLFDAVGDELRKLSAYRLWLRGHHTLQTSTLVKEVVLGLLRIVRRRAHTFPESKEHLLALATRIMICTLADHARRRKETVPLDDELLKPSVAAAISEDPGPLHSWSNRDIDTILSVQEGLGHIERSDPKYGPRRRAALELRLFGGLKYAAIAKELGVSDDIARNDCLTGLARLRELLTLTLSTAAAARA